MRSYDHCSRVKLSLSQLCCLKYLLFLTDYALTFAKLISRTAKDVDTLIDSLPSEESSLKVQLESLRRLEAENQEEARKLEEVVSHGQHLLDRVQEALRDIAQCQLRCQAMETDT